MADIQKAIMDTVDIIADEKLSNLKIDKTIEANILDDTLWKEGKYQIAYQDLKLNAVTTNGAVRFYRGDTVIVFIPEGDFSNDKIILSRKNSDGSPYVDIEDMINKVDKLGANFILEPSDFTKTLTQENRSFELAFDKQGMVDAFPDKKKFLIGGILHSELKPGPGNFGVRIKVKYTLDEIIDKEHTYELGLTSLTGNPYHLNGNYQYVLFSLPEKLKLAEVIGAEIFLEGFHDSTSKVTFTDLEARYAAEKENIVYTSEIKAPNGKTFDAEENDKIVDEYTPLILDMVVSKNGQEYDSDEITYRWFYKDALVMEEDETIGWHPDGGIGWRYLDLAEDRIVIKESGTITKVGTFEDIFQITPEDDAPAKTIEISIDAVSKKDMFKCVASFEDLEVGQTIKLPSKPKPPVVDGEGTTEENGNTSTENDNDEEVEEKEKDNIHRLESTIEILGDLLRENVGYNNVRVSRSNGLEVFDRKERQRVQLGNYERDKYGLLLTDKSGTTTIIDDQGMLQSWQEGNVENVDETHPFVLQLYIPPEANRIHKSIMNFQIEHFRSYSASAKNAFVTSSTLASDRGFDDLISIEWDTMRTSMDYPIPLPKPVLDPVTKLPIIENGHPLMEYPERGSEGDVEKNILPIKDNLVDAEKRHNHGLGLDGQVAIWCRTVKDYIMGDGTHYPVVNDPLKVDIVIPGESLTFSVDGKTGTARTSTQTIKVSLPMATGYWREFTPSGNHVHPIHDHDMGLINHSHYLRLATHKHEILPQIEEYFYRPEVVTKENDKTGELEVVYEEVKDPFDEDYEPPYWGFILDEAGEKIPQEPEQVFKNVMKAIDDGAIDWWDFSVEVMINSKGEQIKVWPWPKNNAKAVKTLVENRIHFGMINDDKLLYRYEEIWNKRPVTEDVLVDPSAYVKINGVDANEYLGKNWIEKEVKLPDGTITTQKSIEAFTMADNFSLEDLDITGMLKVGTWNTIEIWVDTWARINANVFIQAFMTVPRKSLIQSKAYLDLDYLSSRIAVAPVGQVVLSPKRTNILRNYDAIYKASIYQEQGSLDFMDWKGRYGWKRILSVGEAKAITTTFDGYWVYDDYSTKWIFQSETEPWVFWIDKLGMLWGQHHTNEATKFLVSVNAVKVESIRGWRGSASTVADQGIVVAYIKTDGQAYYRNYCTQSGTKGQVWSEEESLSILGINLKDLRMFLTNDYRLGISATSINNDSTYHLTERNWAGMGIPPERIDLELVAGINLKQIIYRNSNNNTENINLNLINELSLKFAGNSPRIISAINIPTITVEGIDNGKEVLFSLTDRILAAPSDFYMKDERGVSFACTEVKLRGDNDYIAIFNNFNNARGEITFGCSAERSKNEIQGNINPFQIKFTPLDLTPIYEPAPKVLEVWNE